MGEHNRQGNNFKQDTHDALTSIKASSAGIYVFLMLVAFVFYSPERYVYIGNHKIAFFEKTTGLFLVVSLILLIVSLVKQIISKEKIRFSLSYTEIALLIYGAWNLISFAFSSYKKGAVFGYGGWHTGLYMQLSLIAVFFAVRRWSDKKELFLKLAASVLIIECAMVIIQRLGFDPFGYYKGMGFMDWNRRNLLGTIGNTNWLMGYEITVIPVLIWLYISAKEVFDRIVWGVGCFITVSAVFLQDAGSGIVAMSVILLFLFAVYIKDAEKLARILEIVCMIFLFWSILSVFHVKLIEPEEKDTSQYYTYLWLVPVVILGLAIGFLYFYMKKKGKKMPKNFVDIVRAGMVTGIMFAVGLFFAIQFSDGLWAALGSKSSLRLSDASGSFRILLWKQTIRHYIFDSGIKDFLFGVGPDSFGYWYETKHIVIPQVGGPFIDAIYTNAHNDFLTTVVNLGIPGAVIFFAVFLSMAAKQDNDKEWAMACIITVIAYVINNVFSFQQVCSTPVFFVIMALLLTPKNKTLQKQ